MLFDLIKAIIYGLTQGLTEFLPVSSSGHLVLLHDFLAIDVNNEIAFDVVLHFGTLLAVLFYFRADILKIIKSFFVAGDKESRKLGIYLALATIPAGASGYFFDDIISTIFRSTLLVAFMLVLVGVLFIISERVASQKFNLSNIKLSQALIIGLAQTLALIPGTSRSGITIVVGLFLGLKREAAARFSFLLSVPIILGAVTLQIPELFSLNNNYFEILIYFIAFISAMISAWWAIGFFLKFIAKNTLNSFAYYRFALALIVLFYVMRAY